jgi:hypothetical protein
MLGNTLAVAGATLVKVNQDNYSSEYMFRDATHQLVAKIRHTKTNATTSRPSYDRHNFEVVETVFPDGEDAGYERKFYFVMEQLPQDTAVALADGVADLMIASTNAFLNALVGWES